MIEPKDEKSLETILILNELGTLRTETKEIAGEVKHVRETVIRIDVQEKEIADKIHKLEEGRVARLETKVELIEKNMWKAVGFIAGIYILGGVVFTIFNYFKK